MGPRELSCAFSFLTTDGFEMWKIDKSERITRDWFREVSEALEGIRTKRWKMKMYHTTKDLEKIPSEYIFFKCPNDRKNEAGIDEKKIVLIKTLDT